MTELKRPKPEDYKSYFGYITALETYCDELEKQLKQCKDGKK